MFKKLISLTLGLMMISACQGGLKSDYGSGLWLQGKSLTEELEKGVNNTIFFAFNSSSLTMEDKEMLNKQVTWWNNSSKLVIVIEGHCDERGTREYNLALGERRANAVKSYLVSQGIPSNKIDTISYGKERPLVIGEGEEVWSKNRRAVTTTSN